MKNVGLTLGVIFFVILFLAGLIVNIVLLKKYKDLVDYFNQDSQLTTDRLTNIEYKLNSLKTNIDDIVPRLKAAEDNSKVLEGSLNLNISKQNEIKRELLSQIQVINDDLLAVRAGVKTVSGVQTKKEDDLKAASSVQAASE